MSDLRKLFVLGDSISIQYGPHLEANLRGKWLYARKTGEAEAMLNLDVPEGANGGDSAMCLAFLRGLVAGDALDADVLLLNCGLHDIKSDPLNPTRKQVPIDAYRANLHGLIDAAQTRGTQVVWVRTTPAHEPTHNLPGMTFWRFNADVDAYNAAADEVMRERGVPTIDLHGFTTSLGPLESLLHDGRHYHEPIQRLQAAYIAGWLDAWRQRAAAPA